MSEEVILEVTECTNDVPSALLAYQMIDALRSDDNAAYMVYLSLACRFGAGQAI
jgi:transcriptional regulator NrdR family protein